MNLVTLKNWMLAGCVALGLVACGGGGSGGTPILGGGGTTNTSPTLVVGLSSTTVSGAAPVTVTATLKDGAGLALPNVVVAFTTTGSSGTFSANSALTDANGVATVTLSPASASATGADSVVATATVGTDKIIGSAGFSLVATTAKIVSFTSAAGGSAASPISAYGQTVLTIGLSGASPAAPVTLSLASACVSAGKATLSSTSLTATSNTVTVTYKDTGGCGSTTSADTLTASISGTTAQSQLQLFLSSPLANNIVFVSATPETIYLKGSGLTTSSQVVFQVNDAANNPLPNQVVRLGLSTFAGGLTIEGAQSTVTQTTDGQGRVTALVNSGTVPTPVRVTAALASGITTVSSNLAVAVGLPSQLNFSLAQQTINIEGYNVDGTPNVYSVLAADRSGNPVPVGTTINFWVEGGQVAATAQTTLISGLAKASASFVSQAPRPTDGRISVVAYALGEESFVDLNGNNVWDPGEPFQDLGDIVKDRLFDFNNFGYDPLTDEFISLSGVAAGSKACVDSSSTYPILKLIPDGADAWIPVRPNTCDGTWTSRTYVRRSIETVLSTSAAQALWGSKEGLSASCASVVKQNGSDPANRTPMPAVRGSDTWYAGAGVKNGALFFLASDANPIRFNPMASGTVIEAGSPSKGLTVKVVGGTPVANTADPFPGVAVTYTFADDADRPGNFALSFRSPGGLGTTYFITIDPNRGPPSTCP